jgi:hypothetical protein
VSEEKGQKDETPAEEAITISKIVREQITGQTIDLSQFNKPKRKRRAKITQISQVLPVLLEQLIK